MNQEKIGKFIASCRKKNNLTQLELAEKLGVTDRSVSKWENGRCMPDLSLFKPLCEELDITINELLSGEKINKEIYQEKFEENIVNTIDYTNKKLNEKTNTLGIILLVFGFLITLTAISIFPSESSWSSFYSIFGSIISLIGFSKLIRKCDYTKRLILNFGFFISFILLLFALDYINVKINKEIPRFNLNVVANNDTILYDTPFYDVYRCNTDKENEYFIIDNNNKYNHDLISNYCK